MVASRRSRLSGAGERWGRIEEVLIIMRSKPTKQELINRIQAHLAYRENSDTVNLLWKGYLAALMEWGGLGPDDYHDLDDLLKEAAEDELREIFLGLPDQDDG